MQSVQLTTMKKKMKNLMNQKAQTTQKMAVTTQRIYLSMKEQLGKENLVNL